MWPGRVWSLHGGGGPSSYPWRGSSEECGCDSRRWRLPKRRPVARAISLWRVGWLHCLQLEGRVFLGGSFNLVPSWIANGRAIVVVVPLRLGKFLAE